MIRTGDEKETSPDLHSTEKVQRRGAEATPITYLPACPAAAPCDSTRGKPMNDSTHTGNNAANPPAHIIANSEAGCGSKDSPACGLLELVPGTVFTEDKDAEKTWSNIWAAVKASLILHGHRGPTRLRGIQKVRMFIPRRCQRQRRPMQPLGWSFTSVIHVTDRTSTICAS